MEDRNQCLLGPGSQLGIYPRAREHESRRGALHHSGKYMSARIRWMKTAMAWMEELGSRGVSTGIEEDIVPP